MSSFDDDVDRVIKINNKRASTRVAGIVFLGAALVVLTGLALLNVMDTVPPMSIVNLCGVLLAGFLYYCSRKLDSHDAGLAAERQQIIDRNA